MVHPQYAVLANMAVVRTGRAGDPAFFTEPVRFGVNTPSAVRSHKTGLRRPCGSCVVNRVGETTAALFVERGSAGGCDGL